MASTVVGLYDRHETAERVMRELKDEGFDKSDIRMVSHERTDSAGWSATSRNWDSGTYGHDLADRLSNLHVPEDEATLYAEGVRRGGTLITLRVDDDQADRVARIMNQHQPVDIETRRQSWMKRGFAGYDRTARPFSQEQVRTEREHLDREESIPIVEEEVKVGKREVSRGGVRLHSHVVSRPVEEQVRLRDETVEVERRNVDRPITDADRAFQDRTIEMRETDEEAVISKEARVTGEVVARKGSEEHTETVRDTVRRTEVDVENVGVGATGRAGFDTHVDDFRTHWRSNYGDSWNDYEPAYRWGYDYGGNDRYRDIEFSRAEADLRRDYEARHGHGRFDRVKDAIEMSYNRARNRRS